MKIRLNIDSVGYTNKPQGVTVAGIRNRLCTASSIREVEPEQFIAAVQRGRSWTPAAMTGTTSDTWQSQQVIAADVDNGGKDAAGNKVCIPDPLTPDQAIEVLGRYGIKPYFMYHSFSNSDTWPRYRVVLILDQALTDQHEAKDLTARLANVLNEAKPGCTDTTIADNARLLFAGRADSAFYQSKQLTTLDTLRRLPEIRKPEPPQRITRPTPTAAMMAGNEARIMDALKAIPCSSTSREQWVSVGMAINSLGWPFEVWDEWSASDPTRYSQRECLKIWRSFKPGKGIDHTFIIHLATENGWTPPRKQPPTPTRPETKGEAMQDHDQEQPQEITEPTAEPDNTQERKPLEVVPHKPFSASEYLTQSLFDNDIGYFKAYEGRKTGFPGIDRYLTLYPGLAALGGASSVGKTTFAVNLADNLLKRGETVIYFVFEQLPSELMAKSITRIAHEIAKDGSEDVTNTDILNGAESKTIAEAKRQYAEFAKNLYYVQADFRMTAAEIQGVVDQFCKEHENVKPCIFIDYLQLIAPPEGFKGGIREYTDENVKAIKEMQKKNGLFVVMISSFNRANSLETASYECFKETGMIEFTCDYVWALQYEILDGDNIDFYYKNEKRGQKRTVSEQRSMLHAEQQKPVRKIEFVSLKSRRAKQTYKAFFDYQPAHDIYTGRDKETGYVIAGNALDDIPEA